MTCEMDCICGRDNKNLYLDSYINYNESYGYKCGQKLKNLRNVVKSYFSRNTKQFYIVKKGPCYLFLLIKFNKKLNLTSLAIQSGFKEIRVYNNETVDHKNWHEFTPAEIIPLHRKKHYDDYPLRPEYWYSVKHIGIVFIGSPGNQNILNFLGVKGHVTIIEEIPYTEGEVV